MLNDGTSIALAFISLYGTVALGWTLVGVLILRDKSTTTDRRQGLAFMVCGGAMISAYAATLLSDISPATRWFLGGWLLTLS
jgi:hypothetical protein